jgi:hypothetical protein
MPQARCFFVLTQDGGQHLGVGGYLEKGSGRILQALACIFSSLKAPWWQTVAKVSQ